jgi:hypothetical protein
MKWMFLPQCISEYHPDFALIDQEAPPHPMEPGPDFLDYAKKITSGMEEEEIAEMFRDRTSEELALTDKENREIKSLDATLEGISHDDPIFSLSTEGIKRKPPIPLSNFNFSSLKSPEIERVRYITQSVEFTQAPTFREQVACLCSDLRDTQKEKRMSFHNIAHLMSIPNGTSIEGQWKKRLSGDSDNGIFTSLFHTDSQSKTQSQLWSYWMISNTNSTFT